MGIKLFRNVFPKYGCVGNQDMKSQLRRALDTSCSNSYEYRSWFWVTYVTQKVLGQGRGVLSDLDQFTYGDGPEVSFQKEGKKKFFNIMFVNIGTQIYIKLDDKLLKISQTIGIGTQTQIKLDDKLLKISQTIG